MTNDEISKWLMNLKDDIGKTQYQPLWHYAEALDMAINALTAQPEKTQLSEEEATSDCISRQAAIEAVKFGITYAKAIDVNTGESKELFKEGNDALKKASERIKDLPSAQLEQKVEELLPDGTLHLFTDTDLSKVNRVWVSQNGTHYGDLYYADEDLNCGADMRGKQDDVISRQAAIDAVRKLYIQSPKISNDFAYDSAIDQAHDALVNLPSAQPERETAKFIRWMECKKTDNYISYTPHCKCSKCGTEFIIETIKYCYICGARMEENDEGD